MGVVQSNSEAKKESASKKEQCTCGSRSPYIRSGSLRGSEVAKIRIGWAEPTHGLGGKVILSQQGHALATRRQKWVSSEDISAQVPHLRNLEGTKASVEEDTWQFVQRVSAAGMAGRVYISNL